MALDTAAKRHSAINWGLPWRTAPIPDGAIAQGDRQHVALVYAGILASEAVADPTVDAGQYARFGIDGTTYPRQGEGNESYSRQAGSSSTYPRV